MSGTPFASSGVVSRAVSPTCPSAQTSWADTRAPQSRCRTTTCVVDAWQGRGLGRLLVGVLGIAAADAGAHTLSWTIDADNTRALRLAGRTGTRRISQGIVEARTAVSAPPAGVDAELVCRLSRSAAASRQA